MLNLSFGSTGTKARVKAEDPAALAQAEQELEAAEAQVAAWVAEIARREEEARGAVEARRQELMGLARSRAGGMAAEILSREAMRALAARRAALEARRAAIEVEQARAEQREQALATTALAIDSLEKGLAQVRARIQRIEAAEAAAAKPPPPPPPAAPAGAKAEPKPSDRRRSPRVALHAEVSLFSESNFYSGFSADLSDGGSFIATCNLLPCGTEVDLTFTLPGGKVIDTHGIVRWTREYNDATPEVFPGVGVEFVQMPEESHQAVRAFLGQRDPLFWVG